METTSTHPLVSVIIPVLNAERFLGDALQSVQQQTYAPLEILVVDGPSMDATARIAHSFPRVRYLRQTGTGMWNALNEGLDAAQGEFIAMLSSDDLWAPEKLQLQVEYLSRHPETGYVRGLTRFVLVEGETPPRSFRTELFQGEHEAILLEVLLARKSLFERVGKFDESLFVISDVDWFARLANLNDPGGTIPRVLLHKRIHADNMSSAPSSGKSYQREMLTAMQRQIQRHRRIGAGNA